MGNPDPNQLHQEMLNHLEPLVKFADENHFNYVITIGKNNNSANYLRGQIPDLEAMLKGMRKRHPQSMIY